MPFPRCLCGSTTCQQNLRHCCLASGGPARGCRQAFSAGVQPFHGLANGVAEFVLWAAGECPVLSVPSDAYYALVQSPQAVVRHLVAMTYVPPQSFRVHFVSAVAFTCCSPDWATGLRSANLGSAVTGGASSSTDSRAQATLPAARRQAAMPGAAADSVAAASSAAAHALPATNCAAAGASALVTASAAAISQRRSAACSPSAPPRN